MKNKLIYAFDFDGTIVTNRFPHIGMPILNTIELIKKVKRDGHYIILNTMREDASLMKALMFCQTLEIKFDAVNDNLPHMKEFYKNNPRKVFANYYIDDHNLFVLGVNEPCEDLKIEQDRHEYYKHEYYTEYSRAENLERALDKLYNYLSGEDGICHNGENQICEKSAVSGKECAECWKGWCLNE